MLLAVLPILAVIALGQTEPAPQGSSPAIGWSDLARVKVLLNEARGELAPGQYQALEQELARAEAAFHPAVLHAGQG